MKPLEDIGQRFVDKIKDKFDSQNLNDTGEAKDSLSYKVEGNKLIIEGKARALFLEFGRRPGTFPPIAPIRAWAIRKLGVSEDEADGVAYLIARKIAREGTDILTDRSKGLQVEILLSELNKELLQEITIFEQARITNGLIKTWQSNK